ncbi:hypothetical protein B0T17DRAFT_654842 [Bombardia bombarda]|uniref:FAD/NAD(P)-binding domain-containing protein n=1 Tax=Bombardia bombarda TaxID=252184 RepID=A0AA39X0H4_9PEZI|nr:hypothetical protein B0T17DRAFT_654842 [Bombardia bombarda]
MATAKVNNNEHPPKADLRRKMAEYPLPVITPGTIDPALMIGNEPTKQARIVLDAFNAAVAVNDAQALENCFFSTQAYWRDQLALTYHLRTFTTPASIAASFLETKRLRAVKDGMELDAEAHFIPVTPVLQFIDCSITFRTVSPAALCRGRMVLLPVKTTLDNGTETVQWKIWALATWIESLDLQPEDKTLLELPRRELDGLNTFETDVFIIGAGNSAVSLAARLKTLGVDSVMIDRNAHPGDNWALRYDCMKFHIPTSFCHLPFMNYDDELLAPHLLTRDELAEQVRRYIATFHLNLINSATTQSTVYDKSTKRWLVTFKTPTGQATAVAKHLVQATGIGSQKPYLPAMKDEGLYKGISLHSASYKNATELRDKGVKTVLIIGSANTAFDILEDCHASRLPTVTMVVRSPTYLIPISYITNPHSLAAYDNMPLAVADAQYLTLPAFIDGQLGASMFRHLATEGDEPARYAALAKAGFPVIDSAHPDGVLTHYLLERAGGHYVDTGGVRLIEEGKVGVKAGTEPVGWTADGVRFKDGSVVGADAVVWCTGFADRDASGVAGEVMGGDGDGEKGEMGGM